MNSLISIVVPVYNVENYLRECLESIEKQTYNHFEVIIVNDGSTDNSLQICEEYCKRDSRFVVYSKQNGGLSDARNFGIDLIKGEYVTFLDSDDYWEIEYLEELYKNIVTNGADIAVANYRRVDENGEISFDIIPGKEKVYKNIDAICDLLYQKNISVSAHSKLYKSELFQTIRFPKGKLYEDISTTPLVFLKAKKVYYSDKVLVNYRVRSGSITESDFREKDIEMLLNTKEMISIIRDFYQENNLSYACKSYLFSKASTFLFLVSKSQHKKKEIYMQEAWKIIKTNRGNILKDKNVRWKNKLGAIVAFFGRKTYIKVYMLRGGK